MDDNFVLLNVKSVGGFEADLLYELAGGGGVVVAGDGGCAGGEVYGDCLYAFEAAEVFLYCRFAVGAAHALDVIDCCHIVVGLGFTFYYIGNKCPYKECYKNSRAYCGEEGEAVAGSMNHERGMR